MTRHIAIAIALIVATTTIAAAGGRTQTSDQSGTRIVLQPGGFASAGGLGSTRRIRR